MDRVHRTPLAILLNMTTISLLRNYAENAIFLCSFTTVCALMAVRLVSSGFSRTVSRSVGSVPISVFLNFSWELSLGCFLHREKCSLAALTCRYLCDQPGERHASYDILKLTWYSMLESINLNPISHRSPSTRFHPTWKSRWWSTRPKSENSFTCIRCWLRTSNTVKRFMQAHHVLSSNIVPSAFTDGWWNKPLQAIASSLESRIPCNVT